LWPRPCLAAALAVLCWVVWTTRFSPWAESGRFSALVDLSTVLEIAGFARTRRRCHDCTAGRPPGIGRLSAAPTHLQVRAVFWIVRQPSDWSRVPGKGYSSASLSYREAWTETFQAKEKRDARAEKMRLFFFYIVMFFYVLEAHRLTLPHGLVARRPGKNGLNWVCTPAGEGPRPAIWRLVEGHDGKPLVPA